MLRRTEINTIKLIFFLLLTDDGKIVPEAPGLCIPEVHPTPVDPLVVTPDVVYDELRRFGRRPEVSPRAEHFRCGPVTRLGEGLAADVQTENKTENHSVLSLW